MSVDGKEAESVIGVLGLDFRKDQPAEIPASIARWIRVDAPLRLVEAI